LLLILAVAQASSAEYIIYLKGGHYVAADNCTFLVRRERVKGGDAEKEGATIVQVEDCAKQKPEEKLEGQIFWSTIDGKFGEVNADEVYYIYGSKELASIAPERKAKPLEDYLITTRGESFVNAKVLFGVGETRVTVRNTDPALEDYFASIQLKIDRSWSPPKVARGRVAIVSIRILRSGQVRDVAVDSSSGEPVFDDSALRAVDLSTPLPPLPPLVKSDTLPLELRFTYQEGEGRVYGLKRDDLANINRRDVTEIVPLADAKSRSGEGLCPGEGAEFDVVDTNCVSGNFIGLFKNLSRESCMEATFEVEIKVNENFRDKFEVKESGAVSPGGSRHFSKDITRNQCESIRGSKNKEGGVQLCWRKIRSFAQCEAEVRQKR
jgi:TonB family protein